MKQGFTLIEFMLAFVLGSLLSGMMYMCLFQSQRIVTAVDRISSIQMRALIARRQLTRDISGAFVPAHILEPKKEKKKEVAPQKESGATKDMQDDKENQKELLAKVFDGTVDNDQFAQLLLITNNPLEIFWSNKAGRPKPRAEKVTYMLEQEKKARVPSYRLMRTTTYAKNGKQKEMVQTYELVPGIKKMTVTYTAVLEEQAAEATQKDNQTNSTAVPPKNEQEKKEEKKIEIKTFNDWAVQAMADDDVRLQKKVPNYVTIVLELWAPEKDKAEAFTFTVPVVWQEIKHKPKPKPQSRQQSPMKGMRTMPRSTMQQQLQQPRQQR